MPRDARPRRIAHQQHAVIDRLTRGGVSQKIRMAVKAGGQVRRDHVLRYQKIKECARMTRKVGRVLAAKTHVQKRPLPETPAVAFEVAAKIQSRLFGIKTRARQRLGIERDEDEEENLFSAAYDDVTYHDSADDNQEGAWSDDRIRREGEPKRIALELKSCDVLREVVGVIDFDELVFTRL